MNLVNKRTTELTKEEIQQYCSCFYRVFHRGKTPEAFCKEFTNTCLGYSFHSLLKADDGVIMGGYTSIPVPYEINDTKMLFAFGVDLMIDLSLRDDVSNLLGIIKANDKVLKTAGVKCFYGFPNDNSYKVNLAFIRMKDICMLDTYILPWAISAVKPFLRVLDPFSCLLAKTRLLLSKVSDNRTVFDSPIHKKQPEFDNNRYLWFDSSEYRHYKDSEMTCHWKIGNFDNIEAAFLMDVYPLSKRNFDKAVSIAYNDCKKSVGLLLYVGYLPFMPCTMIKVPMKYAPKKFHFVAKILDKQSLEKEMVYNGKNWDVNLASYDLL